MQRNAFGRLCCLILLCGCGGAGENQQKSITATDAGVIDAPVMPDGQTPPGNPPPGATSDAAPPHVSPIPAENARSGSSGWRVTAADPARLAAWSDPPSVSPGDSVGVHAAAATATTATWELWRLGFYGGAGGRRVASGGPIAVPAATPAVLDASTGMVRALWPETFRVSIPAD